MTRARKFRVRYVEPGGRDRVEVTTYAVAATAANVRARLEREQGATVARTASITAIADVPPANPHSRPKGAR